jgi:hypothetical protein
LFGAPDTDGARARYFSRQEPNPGNVAYNEALPSQAIDTMFSSQYVVTSIRSCDMATPVGKKLLGNPGYKGEPLEKGVG